MAIVLWIGIVITAQAFQAIPREHAPAAVVGLLPAIGAWGAILTKNAFRAADTVMHQGTLSLDGISGQLADALRTGADTWIHGAFALEQGFIFSSMILAAATVAIIERQFLRAAAWCWVAAGLSFLGLMHSYQWTPKDTVMNAFPMFGGDGMASGVFPWLQRYPTAPWIIGYTVMGLCFLLARWVTEPGDSHESRPALSQRERERGKS
jgi:AGZA family xanthine/uracil permease-like MFS transporter